MKKFTVNGATRSFAGDPEMPLLWYLRDELRLTGTKFGCGEGQCRACTVLVGGECMASCLTPIGTVNGTDVVTIEGLAAKGALHPVQEAFLGAFQCGYCTAGMIMGVAGVLREKPKASEADVLAELQNHICRCGSYTKYLKAVRRVLAERRNIQRSTSDIE